jgi:hypothetical protein
MKSAVVFGMILVGFLLLVASSLWPSLFPGTSIWTDEKAQRSTQVKARLSELGPIVNSTRINMHSGSDRGALKAEFEQLIKEDEQLNAEFQSAYDRPDTAARVLRWSGISLAVIGIVGWFAVKNSS